MRLARKVRMSKELENFKRWLARPAAGRIRCTDGFGAVLRLPQDAYRFEPD